MKSICFVSHNIYPLIAKVDNIPFVGGAELQQSILGGVFKNNGWKVKYITGVYNGKRQDEIIDEFQVIKTFADSDGISGIRFFSPRLIKLWNALKVADCDYYYQRCAGYSTGIIAHFCRKHKKKFVYSGANDTDFIPSEIKAPYLRDKMLYGWGLKNANYRFVQSEEQKLLLKKNFHLEGSIFPNVYYPRKLTENKQFVLWVSTLRNWKRPGIVLDVARRYPELNFKIIGRKARRAESLYQEIESRSRSLKNVEFLGFQPMEKTEEYFDNASVYLNTSEVEGFPNTFLQAWSRGIPVVSFVDVDNFIKDNRLGAIVQSSKEIGQELKRNLNISNDKRREIQNFFKSKFSPESYYENFLKVCGI